MRNIRRLAATTAVALGVAAVLSCDSPTEPLVDTIQFARGHGAPNGAHYNLNIIGVPREKSADMDGDNGHRIFVRLEGKSRIDLQKAPEGESFQVLDANGTDGKASLQLPAPDPDNDGVTEYSVWARALGKPGGSSMTTPCATDMTDPDNPVEYCSSENLILIRDKGKSSFRDASRSLLYVYVDLDGDGVTERYPLFDDALEDYYWNYDNKGLKLAQLRFYMNG